MVAPELGDKRFASLYDDVKNVEGTIAPSLTFPLTTSSR